MLDTATSHVFLTDDHGLSQFGSVFSPCVLFFSRSGGLGTKCKDFMTKGINVILPSSQFSKEMGQLCRDPAGECPSSFETREPSSSPIAIFQITRLSSSRKPHLASVSFVIYLSVVPGIRINSPWLQCEYRRQCDGHDFGRRCEFIQPRECKQSDNQTIAGALFWFDGAPVRGFELNMMILAVDVIYVRKCGCDARISGVTCS